VAVSHEGHISTVGSLEKGVLSATQANSSSREHTLKSWIFPRQECGFPTAFAAPDSSIIVRLVQHEEHSLFLYLDACDASGTIVNGPRIPVLLHSDVRFSHSIRSQAQFSQIAKAAVDITLSSNGGFSCLSEPSRPF
jgi:hypothetical protein